MHPERNGHTLIELLISLVLISVVIILLMSVFTANVNSFARIKNNSELQFQAQYILNFISNRVMKSIRIADIMTYKNIRIINLSGEYSIKRISLLYDTKANSCYIFELKENKIFSGNGKYNGLANSQLGMYIVELRAAPFPAEISFADARALEITVKLAKGDETYEATQLISMRGCQK